MLRSHCCCSSRRRQGQLRRSVDTKTSSIWTQLPGRAARRAPADYLGRSRPGHPAWGLCWPLMLRSGWLVDQGHSPPPLPRRVKVRLTTTSARMRTAAPGQLLPSPPAQLGQAASSHQRRSRSSTSGQAAHCRLRLSAIPLVGQNQGNLALGIAWRVGWSSSGRAAVVGGGGRSGMSGHLGGPGRCMQPPDRTAAQDPQRQVEGTRRGKRAAAPCVSTVLRSSTSPASPRYRARGDRDNGHLHVR